MYPRPIVAAVFLPFLLLLSTPAWSQEIYIGDATRKGEGQIALAVESSDTSVLKIARRAFGLHGGFTVVSGADSGFTVRLERASGSSVLVTIGSGRPYQEQRRETIPGTDFQNAVLRGCDYAVRMMTGKPGFFAGKLAFVGKQRGISEIYTSDLLFSRVRPLTSDRALVTGPSWSPDGTRLLYTTYHKSGFPDIFMIDLRSGRKKPIATFKGTNTGGRFSPDGRRIAMVLSGTGSPELYTANPSGKNVQRLTNNRSLEASPSWSPDGRRLVFTSDAPGKPQLYQMPANGGPSRRIPTNVSSYCSEPVWNPVDANKIAFTAAVSGGFQIALYDASKRKSEILTSGSSSVEPVWTNDGRHLVFTQRQSGRTRLMLLDTETKKASPLHNPNFGEASSATFVY